MTGVRAANMTGKWVSPTIRSLQSSITDFHSNEIVLKPIRDNNILFHRTSFWRSNKCVSEVAEISDSIFMIQGGQRILGVPTVADRVAWRWAMKTETIMTSCATTL